MVISVLIRRSLLAALLLAAAASAASAQVIQSGFDAGLEGWTGSSGGSVTWTAAGGNPGGFLQQADIDLSDMFVIAPAAFLGNLSGFAGGTLSFDAIQVVGTGDYDPFGTVTLRSGGNAVSVDIAIPGNPTAVWGNFAVSLDAGTFGTDVANFNSILGNLTAIEVLLESQIGVIETTGFDNFRIAAVPEPTGLLAVGAVGLGLIVRRRSRLTRKKA